MTNAEVGAVIEKLKKAIWDRRPILGEIIDRHGKKSLFEYALDFLDINKTPRLACRRHELVDVAASIASKRLGEKVGDGVRKQLSSYPLVSTADHHGPITHSFFVNSNIVGALPIIANGSEIEYLIDFSFASVSMNNSSYPRGILFHSGDEQEDQVQKLSIIPDKFKMSVVQAMPAFTPDMVLAAKNELKKKNGLNKQSDQIMQIKIESFLESIFEDKNVLNQPDFASQVTLINFNLWRQFFKTEVQKIPDLIYLEIETVVSEVLIKCHFNNPESMLYKLIFDKKYRQLLQKHFNNIPGAFSVEKDWGSFLFWAIDEKMHRVRLWAEEDTLHSALRRHVFELKPSSIAEALRKKQLFPSMMLCYVVVSLYYGMKCLGGFSQVHDLTLTKKAWQNFLQECGETEESQAVEPVQTKEFGGDGIVLAYLRDSQGQLTPATGIDLAIKNIFSMKDFLEISKKMSLHDLFLPLLPEIYQVLYPQTERDAVLSNMMPNKIIDFIKLSDKLSYEKN